MNELKEIIVFTIKKQLQNIKYQRVVGFMKVLLKKLFYINMKNVNKILLKKIILM